MTAQERSGTAVELANLIKAGKGDSPAVPETPPEESSAVVPARRPRPAAPPAPAVGGWAGAVPRTKIQREQLNAGLPVQLDLLRRLRRYSADSGVDVQDYVAAALHEALEDLGY